jgi:hypothetical protein
MWIITPCYKYYLRYGITRIRCVIFRMTLVVESHLLCHNLSFFVSLFQFWQLGTVFLYWEVMAKDTHRCLLLCTVHLTSIHYRVSGNQNFGFAPTETIDGKVNKIRSPTCGMV